MHPAGRTETTEMTHGGPRRVARSEQVAERSAELHSEWPGRRRCLAPPPKGTTGSERNCVRPVGTARVPSPPPRCSAAALSRQSGIAPSNPTPAHVRTPTGYRSQPFRKAQ